MATAQYNGCVFGSRIGGGDNMRAFKSLCDGIEFPYDLTAMKRLETWRGVEYRHRIIVMLVCGLACFIALDAWEILAIIGIYLAYMQFWHFTIIRLPDQIDQSVFKFLIIGAIVYSVLFGIIILYCWIRPEPVMKFAAILGMVGLMLNSATHRSEECMLTISDFISAFVMAMFMAFDFAKTTTSTASAVFFCFLMLAILGYYYTLLVAGAHTRKILRRAQQVEIRQQKIQALGQLTGGVAHDFNNLLTVIIGNLDMRKAMYPDAVQDELLDEVEMAAHRAAELTSQLLAFSRRSPLEPETVDLALVADHAQVMLNRLLPATHSLLIRPRPGVPDVVVDAGKLETVIINLAINARDAMPDGGEIVISFHHDPNHTGLIPSQEGPALRQGDLVELRVTDHGEGIAPEIMKQVLEPYFTTKSVGKGSGLGLPMAFGFAEQSGGTLTINSTVGVGTQVSVWLPVAPSQGIEVTKAAE